jgi:hypothetical protein
LPAPSIASPLAPCNVVTQEPITASEDFSVFVGQEITFYLSLGGADPQKYGAAKAAGAHLPSNHSSLFAPDVDTIDAPTPTVCRSRLCGLAGHGTIAQAQDAGAGE